MTDSTYSGKVTAPKALTIGTYVPVADSEMPTEGKHAHILLYVNVAGVLLPGRHVGNLDVIAVRDGATGGTDETAVGDHTSGARQSFVGADGKLRYRFQAFIPRTWFLARFDPDGDPIGAMQWRIRADRHSIESATMTTRYGKAWNGQS